MKVDKLLKIALPGNEPDPARVAELQGVVRQRERMVDSSKQVLRSAEQAKDAAARDVDRATENAARLRADVRAFDGQLGRIVEDLQRALD